MSGEFSVALSRRRSDDKLVYPPVPSGSSVEPLYEPASVSGPGRLYSYTVFHPSARSGLSPYALAYVDYPNGARVFGRLELPDDAGVLNGSAVEAVADTGVPSGLHFEILEEAR